MRVHTKVKYYKHVRVGKAPCKYTAKQPHGIGTDVYAEIRVDPILRKRKLAKVRKAMIGHEMYELKRWGKGDNTVHNQANRREPALTRKLGGTKMFWKYVKKEKLI